MAKYILLLLLFCSCSRYRDRRVFINHYGNCKLFLYRDSTYRFRYPTFFEACTEYGSYVLQGDTLALKRTERDHIWYRYFTQHGDTVWMYGMDAKITGIDNRLFLH